MRLLEVVFDILITNVVAFLGHTDASQTTYNVVKCFCCVQIITLDWKGNLSNVIYRIPNRHVQLSMQVICSLT